MKKRIGFFVGWCFLLGSICSGADKTADIACATFGGSGSLAEVSIRNGALHLELGHEEKSQGAPAQQVSPEASNCEVFFSADNQWLAIGTERAVRKSWSVRIQVWDVRKGEWHSQFDVDPTPRLMGYVSLAGFFQKENELVITGKQDEARGAPLTALLVSMDGKRLDGPGYPHESPAEVDAERNRLWSSRGTDGCIMSSASLIGNARGPEVTRPAVQGSCVGPSPIGFPGQNTIVGVASDGDGQAWAWSVAVDTNKSTKTSLAAPTKNAADKWVQATIQPFLSISPDGQAFAVQRTSTHWNRSDNPREMVNEIVVAAVEPLRFLRVVKPKSCSSLSAFAVNHHDGEVEVVGRWCGEWKNNIILDH